MGIGHDETIRRENEARADAVRLLFLWQLRMILRRGLAWHIRNRQPEATEKLQHLLLIAAARAGAGGHFFKRADIHHRRTHLLHQIREVRQCAHLGHGGRDGYQ